MFVQRSPIINGLKIGGMCGSDFSKLTYYKKHEKPFLQRVIANLIVFGKHLSHFFKTKEWITNEKLIKKVVWHCANNSNLQIEKVNLLFQMLVSRVRSSSRRAELTQLFENSKWAMKETPKVQGLEPKVKENASKLEIPQGDDSDEFSIEEELEWLSQMGRNEQVKEAPKLFGDLNFEDLSNEQALWYFKTAVVYGMDGEFLEQLDNEKREYIFRFICKDDLPKDEVKEESGGSKEETFSFSGVLELADEYFTHKIVNELSNKEAKDFIDSYLSIFKFLNGSSKEKFSKLISTFISQFTVERVRDIISFDSQLEKPFMEYHPAYARERRADLLEKKPKPSEKKVVSWNDVNTNPKAITDHELKTFFLHEFDKPEVMKQLKPAQIRYIFDLLQVRDGMDFSTPGSLTRVFISKLQGNQNKELLKLEKIKKFQGFLPLVMGLASILPYKQNGRNAKGLYKSYKATKEPLIREALLSRPSADLSLKQWNKLFQKDLAAMQKILTEVILDKFYLIKLSQLILGVVGKEEEKLLSFRNLPKTESLAANMALLKENIKDPNCKALLSWL